MRVGSFQRWLWRVTWIVLVVLASADRAGAQSELVIHRKGTKEYHRPGCPLIRDAKDVLALTRAQAEVRGLAAHDCEAATAGGKAKGDAPLHVYVDGGRYYHEQKCARLGKAPKKILLDQAGRKFWPCPTCKPPIRKRPR